MVSLKFSLLFWGFLLLIAQFHSGYSLFLGYKKELLKHKLYKLKEVLLSDHHDYDSEIHHYHYKPTYYTKPLYVPSYSKLSYGSSWPSYGGGWHY